MAGMLSMVMRRTPYWLQDAALGWYNSRLYQQRHRGHYSDMRRYFSAWERASTQALEKERSRRLSDFLRYACDRSQWYRAHAGKPLESFPLLEKESLIRNLPAIATVAEKAGVVSMTGGTTGASMKVVYLHEDLQERFALLDEFRGAFGYRLGERTAWFSGKDLATQRDVDKGRCFRDDRRNRIRFFSTFLINRRNFDSYWNALREFQPRFFVGFPSSVLDIALLARERGIRANWEMLAMFPTAETVLPVHREAIHDVFGCKLIDQYASSEGAPFILECAEGRLHIHPLTGVFEVLGVDGKAAQEGEMVVTSFTTRGTPLIRYRIGDRIRLAEPEASCACGSQFPLVEWLDGRTSDFVYSPEHGRINLGNLSNSTKDVEGILSFQVQQDVVDTITVRVVADERFDGAEASKFERNLRSRTGDSMRICIERVDEITRERSGKFRIVKNNISAQLD